MSISAPFKPNVGGQSIRHRADLPLCGGDLEPADRLLRDKVEAAFPYCGAAIARREFYGVVKD